ncbi:hypothetical protein SRHO_G00328760 [Serrasalmus rhombeus]
MSAEMRRDERVMVIRLSSDAIVSQSLRESDIGEGQVHPNFFAFPLLLFVRRLSHSFILYLSSSINAPGTSDMTEGPSRGLESGIRSVRVRVYSKNDP